MLVSPNGLRFVCGLTTLAVFLLWQGGCPSPTPPVDRVSLSSGWADETRCAECHTQGETFWQTGHAQTLRPVLSQSSSERLHQLNNSPPDLVKALQVHFLDQSVRAIDDASGTERQLSLTWCFGSGRHACTWVGTLQDSWGATDLVEFRWTWYSEINDFDVTPGQPSVRDDGFFGGLGVLFDHPKARRCFSCHSSYLPMHSGRLDESAIKPSVTCQRCHGPHQSHLDSGGTVVMEVLRNLDPHESIMRCAQCHRRADEQEPSDIRPDNPEIVRFQPVGLVQSACFKNSMKLTCVTCHDPHRSLEAQDSRGIWQCVQCHGSAKLNQIPCGDGREDDCLTCHMPKIRSNAPVYFTDHWIRVRHDDEISR